MIVNGTVAVRIPTQQQERIGKAVGGNQVACVQGQRRRRMTNRSRSVCGTSGGVDVVFGSHGGPQRASLGPRGNQSRHIQATASSVERASSDQRLVSTGVQRARTLERFILHVNVPTLLQDGIEWRTSGNLASLTVPQPVRNLVNKLLQRGRCCMGHCVERHNSCGGGAYFSHQVVMVAVTVAADEHRSVMVYPRRQRLVTMRSIRRFMGRSLE
jgi:hypothetical protein